MMQPGIIVAIYAALIIALSIAALAFLLIEAMAESSFTKAALVVALSLLLFLSVTQALAAPLDQDEPPPTPTPVYSEGAGNGVILPPTPTPRSVNLCRPNGQPPIGWGTVTPSPYWYANCGRCAPSPYDHPTPTPTPTLPPTVTVTPTPTPIPLPTSTYVVRAQTGAGDCSDGVPIYTGTGEAVISYTYRFTHTGNATFGGNLRLCAISGTIKIPIWATYDWYAEGYRPAIDGEIKDGSSIYDHFEGLTFDVLCGGDWLPTQELESGQAITLPSPSQEGLVADSVMRIGKWAGCYDTNEVHARLRITLWIGQPPGSGLPTPTPAPTPTPTPDTVTGTYCWEVHGNEEWDDYGTGYDGHGWLPNFTIGDARCYDVPLPGGMPGIPVSLGICLVPVNFGTWDFGFIRLNLDYLVAAAIVMLSIKWLKGD